MQLDNNTIQNIIDFLSKAFDNYEGVLIHSLYGKNRCCVAAVIFLMSRFKWGLIKSLEYLNAKKPGLEMTTSLLKHLLDFELKLENGEEQTEQISKDWETINYGSPLFEEERTVVNTYLNSIKTNGEEEKFVPQKNSKRKNLPIKWANKRKIFFRHKFDDENEPQKDQSQTLDQQDYDIPSKQKMDFPFIEQNNKYETITMIDINDINDRQFEDEDELDDLYPLILDETHKQLNFELKKSLQGNNPSTNDKENPKIQQQSMQVESEKQKEEFIKAQIDDNQNIHSRNLQKTNYQDLIDVINKKDKEKSHFEMTFNQTNTQDQQKYQSIQQHDELRDNQEQIQPESPTIKGKKSLNNHKGPYHNPTRASQEQIMRLSSIKKEQSMLLNDDNQKIEEEKINIADLTSNHQYFKKKKNLILNDLLETDNFETNLMNETGGVERYNPLKIIGKDMIKQNENKIDEAEIDFQGIDNDLGQNHSMNKVFEQKDSNQVKKQKVQFDIIPTSFYRLEDSKIQELSQQNHLDQMLSSIRKEPLLRPDEFLSRDRAFSQISYKVDSMKMQVSQSKHSYIEQLKEQADLRRNNFYVTSMKDQPFMPSLNKTNLEKIQSNYKQSSLMDQQSPKDSDFNSVKGDNLYQQSRLSVNNQQQKIILPLIPKAKDFLSDNNLKIQQPVIKQNSFQVQHNKQSSETSIQNLLNSTTSTIIPESILQGEEKIRQQQNLRMQTRLHFLEHIENQKQLYFMNKGASISSNQNQNQALIKTQNSQQQKGVYFQHTPLYNLKVNEYGNQLLPRSLDSTLVVQQEIIDKYISSGRNKGNHFNTFNPSSPSQASDKLNHINLPNYGLDGINSLSQHLDKNSTIITKEDLINKYKYKGANKLQETTRAVIAGTSEKRRIL
ncbi:dual specificity catalytic domain containing protein [Stylonychia lemnae]|uniref:Dual specificity catalytic domain containing protein n=1 Tax=Stylonychia lemnae TaxID=5949 RepID=A0A078AMY6_STYLE|nr:dual specificity catalytic domain containing protein [Stylonychia lemnae]|eukprot:CDW83291.1 dual specificity catalytic domain containing protein [Stylonychia lemnae]